MHTEKIVGLKPAHVPNSTVALILNGPEGLGEFSRVNFRVEIYFLESHHILDRQIYMSFKYSVILSTLGKIPQTLCGFPLGLSI